MKRLLFSFTLIFSITICFSQNKVSSFQWQEDLSFLKETVHKDYSFLFKKVEVEEFDKAIDDLRKAFLI
jgi:hypothetical protein